MGHADIRTFFGTVLTTDEGSQSFAFLCRNAVDVTKFSRLIYWLVVIETKIHKSVTTCRAVTNYRNPVDLVQKITTSFYGATC